VPGAKVLRFLASGAVDPTWATSGAAAIPPLTNSPESDALDMIVGANDVLVTGHDRSQFGVVAFLTTCVLTDGELDLQFGHAGQVATAPGNQFSRGNSIRRQSTGSIVVAGETTGPGAQIGATPGVVRYSTKGVLDNAFGSSGLGLGGTPQVVRP